MIAEPGSSAQVVQLSR